ncbi:hypothetical protein Pmar_PMAR016596 [Perkinsus marinus ATCC 50983]|uniref:Uncharacterized protein n=1 Tax=Perkinsus marinus (strain ATCC 50983 / TXsc) TaxID=423536 RepID=C5KTL7_PERM5|nr:hypothetical protein Pmar_PMAR016596 [Perkinsus marinus ATCC 50983]EER12196.1 hypothetical protein Pmar_PMAR016596 [Perkinsus marinus ATCC 50983]|eukprot:XP_002780401.1 hypothetical protein Pmar_PMAR016596 [Perkinsus marinus ATCC 50983]
MLYASFSYREDGWEFVEERGYPGDAPPDIWLDVSERECISYPEACHARYRLLGIFGVIFACLAALCVLIPCLLDWYMDMLLDSIITDHIDQEAQLKAEEKRRKLRREAQSRAVVEAWEVSRGGGGGLSHDMVMGT